MHYEKIIKRDTGEKYKILASVYFDLRKGAVYSVDVSVIPAGKRKEQRLLNTNSYDYRRLDMSQRRQYEMDAYLHHVTAEEILAAKLELWESIKPQ